MRIQSDSVLTSTAANLQPVADLLPEQFAQLDFDYLGDTLLELVYEPEEPQPYHVRIDLETKKRRGAALVEAAIITSLFLTLVFGMLDLGLILFRMHVASEAARQGEDRRETQ